MCCRVRCADRSSSFKLSGRQWSAQRTLLRLTKFFVVTSHKFRVSIGDRIAVDRNQSVFLVALGDFVCNFILKFKQRFKDGCSNQFPVGFFGMPFKVDSNAASSIAQPSRFSAKVRIVHHFFDFSQPV